MTTNMAITQALAESLSRAESALAAAKCAQRWARIALERHIHSTGACHLCDGQGTISRDEMVEAEDDRLPVWQQVTVTCPFGCAPLTSDPDDFCF